MINILLLAWTHRVKFAFLFLLIAIPISYGIGYWDGRSSMEDQIMVEGLKETVDVQKESNDIRNYRPDDEQLINILRSNKF